MIRKIILLILLLVLMGIAFGARLSPAEAATTLVVNRTDDVQDRKISDTVCDSSPKRGKQCTLRAAIQ